MHYVYTHDKFINGIWVPFYVGKGCGGRAFDFNRNSWHARVANKYKIRATIWSEKLGEKEAFAKEVELIAFLKAEKVALTNMTSGGEGVDFSGELGAKIRRKISKTVARLWENQAYRAAKSGDNNPAKRPDVREKISKSVRALPPASEETRKKISLSHLGKKNPKIAELNRARTGFKHTDETKAVLSELAKLRPAKKHSADARSKIAVWRIGRVWVSRNGETKVVLPSEFPTLIAGGWKLGRK